MCSALGMAGEYGFHLVAGGLLYSSGIDRRMVLSGVGLEPALFHRIAVGVRLIYISFPHSFAAAQSGSYIGTSLSWEL